jgi:hypothetical protein
MEKKGLELGEQQWDETQQQIARALQARWTGGVNKRLNDKRLREIILSPSTDLCSPFDARTCRCNNRTTWEPAPQKQLKSQKTPQNTPGAGQKEVELDTPPL